MKPTGRRAVYCSASCRQAAYVMRKYRRPGAVEALAADLAHVRVREWLRQEIWNLLRQAGLVAAPEPPVLPRRPKPALRIVVSDPGSMPKESNGIETEKQ